MEAVVNWNIIRPGNVLKMFKENDKSVNILIVDIQYNNNHTVNVHYIMEGSSPKDLIELRNNQFDVASDSSRNYTAGLKIFSFYVVKEPHQIYPQFLELLKTPDKDGSEQ